MNNLNPSLSGHKILVVDDEREILIVTKLMLELHGAEVITSLTAAESARRIV
jgi:CheY-like chemotaxis protein